MSRTTFFSGETTKTLTGDDLPARHKSILHLITESNFLSNDQDFSLARPFAANPGRQKSRTSAPSVLHLCAEEEQESRISGKRTLPQSTHKLSSQVDLTWDSTPSDPRPRKCLSKQAETMIQGKLLLRSDLPVPEKPVSRAKQERVGQYMNSHLMQSTLRHRARS